MLRSICSLAAVGILLTAHSHAQSAQPSPGVASNKSVVLVNLNTADVKELAMLPGIGDKTAVRIIDYRQKNGPFKKIEELMNVQGIGEKSFLKLKPQLTVASKPDSAVSPKQH